MLRDKRRYIKFFLIIFFVFLLITLMVSEGTSVFDVGELRMSWFGHFWDNFLIPGVVIVIGPIIFLYDLFSPFLRCPGSFPAGRFCEPYFFYVGAGTISLLYAAFFTGALYGIDRIRHRAGNF